MQRILLTLAAIALLFGSLITFPAYLPWMALIWVVLALFRQAKKGAAWPWLTGCAAIVLVKRPARIRVFNLGVRARRPYRSGLGLAQTQK